MSAPTFAKSFKSPSWFAPVNTTDKPKHGDFRRARSLNSLRAVGCQGVVDCGGAFQFSYTVNKIDYVAIVRSDGIVLSVANDDVAIEFCPKRRWELDTAIRFSMKVCKLIK